MTGDSHVSETNVVRMMYDEDDEDDEEDEEDYGYDGVGDGGSK